MTQRLLIAFSLWLTLLGAAAAGCGSDNPNCIVPTAPAGTSNNQAASTQFVQNSLSSGLPLPSGQIYIGSVANLATAQTISGAGDCTSSLAVNGVLTFVCTKTNGTSFSTLATTTPGTGVATALGVNVGSAGAFVVNGGALGTPSSGVATNLTGTAAGLTAGNVTTNANLTGAVTSTGNATSLGSFTSANLRGALTDETGTGAAYFQGGDIGTPSAGVGTNITGLNAASLASNTVPAARMPALTGDCTTTAGAVATTCTKTNGNPISYFQVNLPAVNFNSANTDTTVTIPAGPNNAYVFAQLIVYNCSASLGTATFALFSGAGGTGTALTANPTSTTGLTNAGANAAGGSLSANNNPSTTWWNQASLFFRVLTAQGSAATCNVSLRFQNL